jgi:tryptophanyl-tRNA synthetase
VILETVGTVPGVDGQKMSKSYKNTIPLFGSREEIAAAVMSIVTDSSGERPENVYAIHKLFKSEADLANLYEEKKGKYKDLKEALIEDIEAAIAPMRSKYNSINEDEVKRVLKNGAERARALASAKMQEVREKVGVTI